MDLASFVKLRLLDARSQASIDLREAGSDAAGQAVKRNARQTIAWADAALRIVARHHQCGTGQGYCDDGGHGWDDQDGGGCGDLADLASVYADHVGYQEHWAS